MKDDTLELLLKSKHMRKALKDIGRCKGRIGRFMVKVREGKVSDEEIAEFIRKDFEKIQKELENE